MDAHITPDAAGTLAAPPSDSRSRLFFGLSWPLFVALVAFVISLRPALLSDPDSYWHVATAKWMVEHLAVPMTDPFSATMAGKPWVAHEWLAELVLGAAHALAGWSGMAILAAASFALAMAMLCRYLLRHLEPIYALFLTALAGAMAFSHLLARPHALVLPILVGWGILLLKAREAGRAPHWSYGAIMVLWANLHGSFLLGVVIATVFAVEAVLEATGADRRIAIKQWSAFLCLVGAATLATPFGIDGILFPLMTQGSNETNELIAEWRSPSFHEIHPLEIGIMAVGAAFLWRGIRLPATRIFLLLALLHLALKHVRHGELLGLLAPLVLAQPVAVQWRGKEGVASEVDRVFAALAARAGPVAMGGIALLAALFGWWRSEAGVLRPAAENTPELAVAAALAARPQGGVLNDYNFGGYLIHVGIPTFIDGRGEPFGERYIADYQRAVTLSEPERFFELLEKNDIGWTLLRPSTPAVALLDHLPEWRRLYADKTAVVHVRSASDRLATAGIHSKGVRP